MTGQGVLIIGAGAVGTLLACDLLQQSVPVRIVDAKPPQEEFDPHSRAVMIWPRVLELLEKTGIADELVSRGFRADDVSFFSRGRRLGTVPMTKLGAARPYGLGIVQSELEVLLHRRLTELGGTIEYGTELTALDTSGPLPTATLRHTGGRTEQVETDWLIGADGAGSVTRRLLGIPYPGIPFPLGIALGDFPVTGPRVSTVEYHYADSGLLPLVHLPDGVCRLATIVAPGETDWSDRPLADWQRMVDERTSLPYRLGEPLWTRTYHPRPGVAERFREGRVVLVGDAAHSVVPLGGQGLNLGLQDAFNLGWKLAGVVRGDWDERIVDTYDTERRKAVEQVRTVIRTEMQLSGAATVRDRRLRDLKVAAAHRTGLLRHVAAPLMSQIGLGYAADDEPLWRSALHRRARPGDRLPFFHRTRQHAGAPVLDQREHIALLWPGRRPAADWQTVADGARRVLADRLAVHDLARLSPSGRAATAPLFGRQPVIALVRPDGHLAHLAAAHRPAESLGHLDRLVSRPPTPSRSR
ncbi:FAD-dependent monooxygenase [Streptomyces lavendulae]|uniref:FAD-dependent monooxygenase n=1 Tax=Streptomyces lavendulae TaxID=1914 RepID=UPI0036C2B083